MMIEILVMLYFMLGLGFAVLLLGVALTTKHRKDFRRVLLKAWWPKCPLLLSGALFFVGILFIWPYFAYHLYFKDNNKGTNT